MHLLLVTKSCKLLDEVIEVIKMCEKNYKTLQKMLFFFNKIQKPLFAVNYYFN